MSNDDIPDSHPRAASLRMRALIEKHVGGIVASAGPIAHGRGEAFDYILGEETPSPVREHIRRAAALLLAAKRPVISVNGNMAALVPAALVRLSESIPAPLEVNIFYNRVEEREKLIARHLQQHGARHILGVNAASKVPYLDSARSRVDQNGIAAADVVLVGLEDGDRTNALVRWGKKVISIDLNPFSRSAADATMNVCDNIVRALPLLTDAVIELRSLSEEDRARLITDIDKPRQFQEVTLFMLSRLQYLAGGA